MRKVLKLILSTLALAAEPTIIAALHAAFRKHPKLKATFTEALSTFDTEAGGTSMNLNKKD